MIDLLLIVAVLVADFDAFVPFPASQNIADLARQFDGEIERDARDLTSGKEIAFNADTGGRFANRPYHNP